MARHYTASPDPNTKAINRTSIVVAIIGLFGIIAGPLIGWAIATSGSSTQTDSGSSTQSGPTTVSIDKPNTGQIHYPEDLSGTFDNLKPDQQIWTYNQPINTTAHSAGTNDPSKFYANTGPCIVNLSRHTWSCREHVGEAGPSGLGQYRIWVVVVNSNTSYAIVADFRCGNRDCNSVYTDNATRRPPHVDNAYDSMDVMRVP